MVARAADRSAACCCASARAVSPDRYLRAFDIVGLLTQHSDGLRLTEIRESLGLPVSSLHNILQTMVAAEILTVTDDLRYSVGPRMVGVALATVSSLDVRNLARRYLQDLAKEVGDDVYLGMMMGRRVFYVDRCAGTQRISLDIRLGEPLHLHATATGKLFAAFDQKLAARALSVPLKRLTPTTITEARELEAEYGRIRNRGYSKSDEEAVEGVVGYAIPILQASGALAAAIHVSVIGQRATKAHERALVRAARECAGQVERSLGHVQKAGPEMRPAAARQ
jgi:DNA-binding IclR family transcriptional regulator